MSCHTWSYRLLNDSEFEETKKSFLESKMGRGSFAHQTCPDITEDEQAEKICQEYKKVYGEDIAKDVVLVWIKRDTECVEKLNASKTLSDLSKIIENHFNTADYKVIGNKIYEGCGFDEPIRIYGYPEETFTDPAKFIEWVKKREEELGHTISQYYLYDIDGTKREVKGYTPEMEILINKFWQKYNNNVYVEFG